MGGAIRRTGAGPRPWAGPGKVGAVPGQARECGAAGSLVPWLVPLPRHGSALLALVALVVLDSDLAAFQEHPE